MFACFVGFILDFLISRLALAVVKVVVSLTVRFTIGMCGTLVVILTFGYTILILFHVALFTLAVIKVVVTVAIRLAIRVCGADIIVGHPPRLRDNSSTSLLLLLLLFLRSTAAIVKEGKVVAVEMIMMKEEVNFMFKVGRLILCFVLRVSIL